MTLKLCQLFINWVLNPYQKTFSCKNYVENMHQKLVPDLFLILLNNPKQPLHARNASTNKAF